MHSLKLNTLKSGMLCYSIVLKKLIFVDRYCPISNVIYDDKGRQHHEGQLFEPTKKQVKNKIKKLNAHIADINVRLHTCNEFLSY